MLTDRIQVPCEPELRKEIEAFALAEGRSIAGASRQLLKMALTIQLPAQSAQLGQPIRRMSEAKT